MAYKKHFVYGMGYVEVAQQTILNRILKKIGAWF